MPMRVKTHVTHALTITTHSRGRSTARLSHLASKSTVVLTELKFALTQHTVAGVRPPAALAQMDSSAPREANLARNGTLVALVAHIALVAFRPSAPKANLASPSGPKLLKCVSTAHQATTVSQVRLISSSYPAPRVAIARKVTWLWSPAQLAPSMTHSMRGVSLTARHVPLVTLAVKSLKTKVPYVLWATTAHVVQVRSLTHALPVLTATL